MDSAVVDVLDVEDARYAAILSERAEFEGRAKTLMLHPNDLRTFLDGGYTYETIPSAQSPMRKAALTYLRSRGGPLPKWSAISGIMPAEQTVTTPKVRREQLRALYRATVLLIRRSLAWHEADPNKSERTIFWDPAIEVCRELEISPSKLSGLLKEYCGNSLVQTIDCVRVEKVKKVLRSGLREFLTGFVRGKKAGVENRESGVENGEKGAHGASFATELDDWGVWKALKKARKWPEFSQNTWANGLGFATYRRLYRACVAVFGKTPHQIEMELIRELLAEGAPTTDGDGKTGRMDVPDFVELDLTEIERLLREIKPYAME